MGASAAKVSVDASAHAELTSGDEINAWLSPDIPATGSTVTSRHRVTKPQGIIIIKTPVVVHGNPVETRISVPASRAEAYTETLVDDTGKTILSGPKRHGINGYVQLHLKATEAWRQAGVQLVKMQ